MGGTAEQVWCTSLVLPGWVENTGWVGEKLEHLLECNVLGTAGMCGSELVPVVVVLKESPGILQFG